jgi:TPR repeat protein
MIKRAIVGLLLISCVSSSQTPADNVEEIKALAQSGNAVSQYQLGLLYEQGALGESNRTQARYWYQKAADGGDKDAALVIKLLNELSADNTTEIENTQENSIAVDAQDSITSQTQNMAAEDENSNSGYALEAIKEATQQ